MLLPGSEVEELDPHALDEEVRQVCGGAGAAAEVGGQLAGVGLEFGVMAVFEQLDPPVRVPAHATPQGLQFEAAARRAETLCVYTCDDHRPSDLPSSAQQWLAATTAAMCRACQRVGAMEMLGTPVAAEALTAAWMGDVRGTGVALRAR